MRKFFIIACLTLGFCLFSGGVGQASPAFYDVKAGDSLWKISHLTGVSIDNLKKYNGLKSDLLKIGQRLFLAANTPAQSVSNQITPNVSGKADNSADESIIYIVKPGDSLWSIANRHHISISSIREINGLISDLIHVGDQLKLAKVPANSSPNQISRSQDSVGGMRIIEVASAYLGTPYLMGGASPGGFDCSGFVKYIYSQFQIDLPRTAGAQYGCGVAVGIDSLSPGDLLFWDCSGGSGIDHVGIYAGNGRFIHSSSPRSGGVIYSSMSENYYARSYVGARRIIR